MVSFSLLLGIFLTSAATLVLEISSTRLLSVAQGYHFAFMVVSMALSFGFETVLFLAAILYSVGLLAAWKSC